MKMGLKVLYFRYCCITAFTVGHVNVYVYLNSQKFVCHNIELTIYLKFGQKILTHFGNGKFVHKFFKK